MDETSHSDWRRALLEVVSEDPDRTEDQATLAERIDTAQDLAAEAAVTFCAFAGDLKRYAEKNDLHAAGWCLELLREAYQWLVMIPEMSVVDINAAYSSLGAQDRVLLRRLPIQQRYRWLIQLTEVVNRAAGADIQAQTARTAAMRDRLRAELHASKAEEDIAATKRRILKAALVSVTPRVIKTRTATRAPAARPRSRPRKRVVSTGSGARNSAGTSRGSPGRLGRSTDDDVGDEPAPPAGGGW